MLESMIAWLPEFLFVNRAFASGLALVCDETGTIVKIVNADQLTAEKKINLPRRALLPGLVNAHSHAFQRVIRGRTEYRSHRSSFRGGVPAPPTGRCSTQTNVDGFWRWAANTYSAATRATSGALHGGY